jgi:ABC-2 type transport system ATP-binding protein
MEPVLKVEHLTKTVKGKRLVDDVSFSVQPGEIFGFLGPNGAGKTTTIRMLVGLIKPSGGTIILGGHNVQTSFKKAMRQVGSIVENPELYGYLTGWENLRQFSRMLGGITEERIEETVKQVKLDKRIHEKVKTYSLGMKQRLGIAQALLGDPKLLILDEPTNGLDPSGIRELRTFVRNLVEEKQISVFISSHLLSEIQLMCDRVAIINKGHMVTVAEVSELIGPSSDRIEWRATPLNEAYALLERMEEVHGASIKKDRILCTIAPSNVSRCIRMLVENGIEIHSVHEKPLTLEELFMDLTKEEQA